MRSLWFKLIGAFAAVIAVTLGMVILVVNIIAARQFDLYVARSGEIFARNIAPLLERSYRQNGDWSDAQEIIANPREYSQGLPPPQGQQSPTGHMMGPGSNQGGAGAMGDPNVWQQMGFAILLADEDGTVITDTSGERIDQVLPRTLLDQGTPLMVNGRWVGTLLVVRPDAESTARSEFLHQVQRAAILAGLASGLVALLIGTLLFQRIIEPLRSLQSAAHRVSQGDLTARVAITANDELTDMARAFNTMAENLSTQLELRKKMVADIAHELRTPISVLQGSLEAMQDGLIPPSTEELSDLHDDVRRLGRLVEDLRTLSLGDAGQLTLLREPVDVGGLAEHVASRMVPIASERGVDLNVETRANLPNVNADEDRLAQVITNLVENALRHTPRGGAVTVRARSENTNVVLEVADTGPGIAPADQPYLFERFWRADQSRNRNSGGSGLGLAIVRQLVELHGGSIGVESKLGAGAIFRVSLPAES